MLLVICVGVVSEAKEAFERLRLSDRFLARALSTSFRKRSIVASCSSVGQSPVSVQQSTRASLIVFHLSDSSTDVRTRFGNGSSEGRASETSSSRGRFRVFARRTELGVV
jgi:hypothetical protein